MNTGTSFNASACLSVRIKTNVHLFRSGISEPVSASSNVLIEEIVSLVLLGTIKNASAKQDVQNRTAHLDSILIFSNANVNLDVNTFIALMATTLMDLLVPVKVTVLRKNNVHKSNTGILIPVHAILCVFE